MALITCGSCGKQISSKARTCPKCGAAQSNAQPPVSAHAPAAAASAAALQPFSREPGNKVAAGTTGIGVQHVPVPTPDVPTPEMPSPPVERRLPTEPSPFLVEEPIEEWYYVGPAGRQGPVSFDMLKRHLATGEIEATTLIWNAGMPDWVSYGKYLEQLSAPPVAAQADEPPLVSENRVFLSWALALAPLWGSLVQIFVTELKVALTHKTLSYYSQLWWITVALNMLVAYIDYRNLSTDGSDDTRSIETWLFAVVPWYIYRRDKILKAGASKLLVWVVSFLLSVTIFHYLNGWDVQTPLK